MTWLFLLLALVLVVALALALTGRLPAVPQPSDDRYAIEFTQESSTDDIDHVRFPVVFRGYRMQDVDAVICVLQDRITALEAQSAPIDPAGAGDE